MQSGKAGTPVSAICQAFPDRVEVRGRDLTGELMGRVSFTDYFHLLVTGREPTDDQRFFLDLLLVAIAEHGMMPTNVAARMTLAADPGLAAGRGRGGHPRLRPGHPRHLGAVRQAARAGPGAGARRRGARRGRARAWRRRSARPASRAPGFGHPVHRPLDPRAERILELADARGASGAARGARARVPRGRRRGLGQAADDERLDADRRGDARPGLPVLDGQGDSAARAHGRAARAPRGGAGAARPASPWPPRPSRRSSTSPSRNDARARDRDAAVGRAAGDRRRLLPRAARLPLRALALLPRQADGSGIRLGRRRRRPRGHRPAAADREGGAQGHRHRRTIPSARISAQSVPRSCASTPRAARRARPATSR